MIPIPDRLSIKLIIGIGCALLLALLIHDRNRWKAKTAHYAEVAAAERATHAATVASYRAAAERARQSDAANAARVKANQTAINERTAHDFESRIAAARASAKRLRNTQPAAADSSRGRAAPVPALSAAAEGIAASTSENRLPKSDRLIATEQAIQLDELITWALMQHDVSANGPFVGAELKIAPANAIARHFGGDPPRQPRSGPREQFFGPEPQMEASRPRLLRSTGREPEE